ncbi:TIGR03620 family F420-dependent LLM class oxidoreductase [Microbacterium lushaniae]|nr:TIGR03620 family F420-dependent LLM class oxidoreductase [Microbacterium lushaniae]KAA9159696.1 TIGR03620 family F420-dependent LLM class oxidoreductase [Microbacterium lushaniae]
MTAASAWSTRLGQLGVWARVSEVDVAFAREAERLGYGTVWLGGSPSADLQRAEEVLDGTESVVVATGIVNIWRDEAAELADAYHRIVARHPGRLVLGIGSGHREATPHRTKPLQAMADYLDVLDERGVPIEDRVLSALGPRMLALAAERSGGTHPYLTVPSQTAEARAALGPDKLVAPEQTVVLDADVDAARRAGRAFLRRYLQLTNYTGNMRRAGFTEADVAGEGSDELIDRIVVHGEAPDLVRAVRAHLEAGADHVCVQVQPDEDAPRALAEIAAAFAG